MKNVPCIVAAALLLISVSTARQLQGADPNMAVPGKGLCTLLCKWAPVQDLPCRLCKSADCVPAYTGHPVPCAEALPFLECMAVCRKHFVYVPGECHFKYCTATLSLYAHDCPADCPPNDCIDFVDQLSAERGGVDITVMQCLYEAAAYNHGLFDDPPGH